MTKNIETVSSPAISLIGRSVYTQLWRRDISNYLRGRVVVNMNTMPPMNGTTLHVQTLYYADIRVVLYTGNERNIVMEAAVGSSPHWNDRTAFFNDDGPIDVSDIVCDFEHGDSIAVEGRAMNAGHPDPTVYTLSYGGNHFQKLDAIITLHGEKVAQL